MDGFDYLEQPSPPKRFSDGIWNVLTVLVLLAVFAVVVVFGLIFINPQIPLNPFPPEALPEAVTFPTPTPTSRIVFEPTWTPVPTIEPTGTATAEPTATFAPTETAVFIFPASPTVEQTQPAGGFPFVISPGTPVGVSSLAFHPAAGCNWLGVAGQVFDLAGSPVSGQQIQLGGSLAGKAVDLLSLTGVTTAYGTAGFYEFQLGDQPVASTGTLWLQLLDQAGLPMSEKVYFDTYADCEKNLIFVNFKQVR